MVETSDAVSPTVQTQFPPSTTWSTPNRITNPHKPISDLLALPERLNDMPEWIRVPLRRFLRLKQRNWPSKTVQQSTRQLFYTLSKLVGFFIQQYDWSDWDQLSLRWLDDFIDTRIRDGRVPATINWDLISFRGFCYFLIDEGYNIPKSILRLKILNTPRRLPRPLSNDQVCRLERFIQTAVVEKKTESQRQLAVRDLACFYLLWHCGLRNSEVCSLLVADVDLPDRKLFVRNSKERKDRVVYMSETTVTALQHHLDTRSDSNSAHLFTTRLGSVLKTRSLLKRLRTYGHQCSVPVTAQRLRHTFASQMLAAGVPVTSLQRYLGHELLDTTMIYAEVSDPMLQQDYYHGIATLDPKSAILAQSELELSRQEQLRQLLVELKTPNLEPAYQSKILCQMENLLNYPE
jgi:site-specific recombinase XerD